MPLFTTPRERRFWLLALVTQLAIYSTVGLAGTLAEALRNEGLLGVSFGLGFLVVIVAIVGSTLNRFPRYQEVLAVIGVVFVYGMIVVRMGVGAAERTHIFEYGLVATFIHQALLERRRPHPGILLPGLVAVVLTAGLGWIDEGIQWLIPGRVYDLRDVGVNALAGLMAVLARLVLLLVQRRWRRPPERPRNPPDGA